MSPWMFSKAVNQDGLNFEIPPTDKDVTYLSQQAADPLNISKSFTLLREINIC